MDEHSLRFPIISGCYRVNSYSNNMGSLEPIRFNRQKAVTIVCVAVQGPAVLKCSIHKCSLLFWTSQLAHGAQHESTASAVYSANIHRWGVKPNLLDCHGNIAPVPSHQRARRTYDITIQLLWTLLYWCICWKYCFSLIKNSVYVDISSNKRTYVVKAKQMYPAYVANKLVLFWYMLILVCTPL